MISKDKKRIYDKNRYEINKQNKILKSIERYNYNKEKKKEYDKEYRNKNKENLFYKVI
jgi:hypothetical protein